MEIGYKFGNYTIVNKRVNELTKNIEYALNIDNVLIWVSKKELKTLMKKYDKER